MDFQKFYENQKHKATNTNTPQIPKTRERERKKTSPRDEFETGDIITDKVITIGTTDVYHGYQITNFKLKFFSLYSSYFLTMLFVFMQHFNFSTVE